MDSIFKPSKQAIMIVGVVIVGLFIISRNTIAKIVLKKVTVFELYVIQACFLMVFHPLIIFLFWKWKLIEYDKISTLSSKEYFAIVASALSSFGIFIVTISLLKRYSLSKIITLQTTFQILLATIVGYFVLREKLNAIEYTGIGFIVLGVILLTGWTTKSSSF
tara:strand:+ start:1072 stop:1560 length:489 start_codon:yes stop_codon:yes gene_type:complete